MDEDQYKILIKYLVKRILSGLNTMKELNIPLDIENLNINESLIINTTKLNSEKQPDIKIKFFNIIPSNTKSNSNYIQYGNMLIDILSNKYKLDYNTSFRKKRKDLVLSIKKIFVNKSTKQSIKNKTLRCINW